MFAVCLFYIDSNSSWTGVPGGYKSETLYDILEKKKTFPC